MNRIQKILLTGGLVGLAGCGIIIGAGLVIEHDGAAAVARSLQSLPHRPVALVLGCSPTTGTGHVNPFFVKRMQAAAAVYHAHKADYLLVSGDNHANGYDEPAAMKNALVRLGVPDNRIALDPAGFSTFESIARARAVFGLQQFCIVTQREHALRAIFIAHRQQLDVVAYPASDVRVMDGLRTRLRESVARVRAILDVTILHRQPRFCGPRIQIGGGPDRTFQSSADDSAIQIAGQIGRAHV